MYGQHRLVVQDIGGISEDREESRIGQLWVVLAELLTRPPFGQQREDKIHSKAGALDDGFTASNTRIRVYVIAPGHAFLRR